MDLDREAGSQAVEFALVLPAVALAALLVLHTAVLGSELVALHALAAQAARAAAVDGTAAAHRAAARTPGAQVSVAREPGGDGAVWYVVELSAPSRAFGALGRRLPLRAGAVARAQ